MSVLDTLRKASEDSNISLTVDTALFQSLNSDNDGRLFLEVFTSPRIDTINPTEGINRTKGSFLLGIYQVSEGYTKKPALSLKIMTADGITTETITARQARRLYYEILTVFKP